MIKIIKDKKNILIFLLGIFLSLFSTAIIQFNYFKFYLIKYINIPLFFLILIFITYLFSHFLFKINSIYNFIYKKRFIISILILFIIVLGKFNGSSLGCWNNLVQPNQNYSDDTIIGQPLRIRSDEFLVNLSYTFSQFHNDFKYRSDNMMSGNVDMFTSTTAPVKDILILAKPFTIGYLIFGKDYGLSFYWYGRLIALLLISFEFCMLITNKNKVLSCVGMFFIAGSSAVAYWYSNYIVDLLIYGQLCIILFNLFLKNNKSVKKILYSILLGLSFSSFALVLYPAWQIPLGYMFLMFGIYIFIKNFKNNKNIGDYKFLVLTLLIVIFFIGRYLYMSYDTIKLIMSTAYPGKRVSIGGGAFYYNFTYIISPLFSYLSMNNPCEVSSFISLFPIPMILAIVYLVKNKKSIKDRDNLLILLLLILSIIFTIYTAFEIPSIVSKLTLLSMSTSVRVALILALINIYILIILMTKITPLKIKNSRKIIYLLLSILIALIGIFLAKKGIKEFNPTTTLSYINITIIFIVFVLLFFSVFCIKEKKYKNIFIIIILIISIINLFHVNPVNVGTDQIYKKSISKKIEEIVNKDNKSKWIALDSIMYQNYLIMNGANSINATNIYPNLKLWENFDKKSKNVDIYNRYAHVIISLTDKKTSFKLSAQDLIRLNLNYKDIDLLNVDYIVCDQKIDAPKKYKNNFKKIYEEDGMYIYQYNNKKS